MKARSTALDTHESAGRAPRDRQAWLPPARRDDVPRPVAPVGGSQLLLARVSLSVVEAPTRDQREVLDVTGEVVRRPFVEALPFAPAAGASLVVPPPPAVAVAARYLANVASGPPVAGRSVYA